MCFSVNVNLIKEELEERYGVLFPDKYRYHPSYYYHAFSLPEIPALCTGSGDNIELLKWGLIPSWVKSPDDANEIRYKTFNARAETLEVRPSFSGSLRSKRCLVPLKGFFEWQHTASGKIPWYIYQTDDDILSVAGLYDHWTDPATGETLKTFSIITTEANDMMAVIHNSKKRMPAVLDKDSEEKWIDLSVKQEDAMKMLKPCPSDFLRAHTISPLVNSKTADRNDPSVIRPYNWETDNKLF